jgi:hypothetical protein
MQSRGENRAAVLDTFSALFTVVDIYYALFVCLSACLSVYFISLICSMYTFLHFPAHVANKPHHVRSFVPYQKVNLEFLEQNSKLI